jgi:hypothetical protein
VKDAIAITWDAAMPVGDERVSLSSEDANAPTA